MQRVPEDREEVVPSENESLGRDVSGDPVHGTVSVVEPVGPVSCCIRESFMLTKITCSILLRSLPSTTVVPTELSRRTGTFCPAKSLCRSPPRLRPRPVDRVGVGVVGRHSETWVG